MKILLAIDGSECSREAADEVARRPWPADSQVRVISVVEPPAPLVAEPYSGLTSYFEEVEQLKRKEAGETVEAAAAKL
jgi:nucleotide-binding universal stress UspA family protein